MAQCSSCRSWPDKRRLREFCVGVLTAGLLALVSVPVMADGDRHRGHGHGKDKHGRHHDHDRGGDRQRDWRSGDPGYYSPPVYLSPYVYSQPVYVPPPVYYAPRQSPGITLFFPLDLR